MNKAIKISDGPSFKLFYIGLAIIGLSVYFFFLNLFLAGLFFIIGLSLFLSINGILIDIENARIKRYYLFLLFKIGDWESLSFYKNILLTQTSISQVLNLKSLSNSVHTKTFDIYLSNVNYTHELFLKEFTDYGDAKEFLYKYSELLQLEAFDEVAEIREAISKRAIR